MPASLSYRSGVAGQSSTRPPCNPLPARRALPPIQPANTAFLVSPAVWAMDLIERRKHGCRSLEYERHGLRTVTLENRGLRVTVLPDKGSDIVELRLKALDLDVLWSSPSGLRDLHTTRPSSEGLGAFMDL